jgi:hypothetical protein
MQRDSATYCDEPEDGEDYAAWQATFSLAGARPEARCAAKPNCRLAWGAVLLPSWRCLCTLWVSAHAGPALHGYIKVAATQTSAEMLHL